jgi:hypothetical protein
MKAPRSLSLSPPAGEVKKKKARVYYAGLSLCEILAAQKMVAKQ